MKEYSNERSQSVITNAAIVASPYLSNPKITLATELTDSDQKLVTSNRIFANFWRNSEFYVDKKYTCINDDQKSEIKQSTSPTNDELEKFLTNLRDLEKQRKSIISYTSEDYYPHELTIKRTSVMKKNHTNAKSSLKGIIRVKDESKIESKLLQNWNENVSHRMKNIEMLEISADSSKVEDFNHEDTDKVHEEDDLGESDDEKTNEFDENSNPNKTGDYLEVDDNHQCDEDFGGEDYMHDYYADEGGSDHEMCDDDNENAF